jgi:hypothetical protein
MDGEEPETGPELDPDSDDPSPGTPPVDDAAAPDAATEHVRRRSNLPWVLSAIFGVIVVIVLWVAVAGVPAWPGGLPGFPGSSSGNSPPGGGGSDATVILTNGTVWGVAAGHFEAVWFDADGDAQAFGAFHSTVPVRFWIIPSSGYGNWSGTNSTYGTDPSAGSPAEATYNWSTGPVATTSIQQVILGDGPYDLIVENTNASVSASVRVVQPIYLEPFDTS